jgi:hypothetical protein
MQKIKPMRKLRQKLRLKLQILSQQAALVQLPKQKQLAMK